MKKVIETTIQKRFADIDMFRHVNNIHQQQYLDLGKTDYYHGVLELDALTDDPTLMIVSVKSDFARQVRYEDEIVVRTWVERIGTKSITLRQQIVALGVGGSGAVGEAARAGRNDSSTETRMSAAGRCGKDEGDNGDTAASQSAEVASPAEMVCTESESVLVCFDLGTQRTVELPDAWRERINLNDC